jgi:hypothetical protein
MRAQPEGAAVSSDLTRDGGNSHTDEAGAVVLSAAGYSVDIDSLRSTANLVLGVADRVESASERRPMQASEDYGYSLPAAASTWTDRFTYLLHGLADEIENAGYQLRGTADAYSEVDVVVEARARHLHEQLRSMAAW